MKCIILCAGYATRLYPLTLTTPKHLLKIGNKAILDYVIEKLPMEHIDQIYVVTNNKFYQHFLAWHAQFDSKLPLMVLNDRTMSNEDRLGSMGDVLFVIDQTKMDDDFMLISGDNLFNFDLRPMLVPFFEGKNVVALYDVQTIEEAKKMGIPTVNAEGIITHLIEKPEHPATTLSSIGIYLFHREVIQLLRQYIQEGNSPDKVGEFIGWLCHQIPLYSYRYDGPNDLWLDIGTPSQLELAKSLFAK